MGLDKTAVVDSRLKVYGVDGLRVVDASIMPSVVSGNLQASIYMIGEKGADMIRQDAGQANEKGTRVNSQVRNSTTPNELPTPILPSQSLLGVGELEINWALGIGESWS